MTDAERGIRGDELAEDAGSGTPSKDPAEQAEHGIRGDGLAQDV